MKHSRLLYVSVMILGISILITFFAAYHWYYSNIYILEMPILEQIFSVPYSVCVFLSVGPVLVIIGVLGADITLIKKHQEIIAISIPVIVILLFFCMWNVASNHSLANSFAARSEITKLTVVSNSPLVLSLV